MTENYGDSGSYDGGRSSERFLPPQDLEAERSVLGGMMLSKDAIADVVELLRGHDFYRPSHEMIYEAIIDLYGRGEPCLLYTSPSPRDGLLSRMPSSA